MRESSNQPYLKGYILLPPSKFLNYHGIDRNPFEPILLQSEIDLPSEASDTPPRVSDFYPKGWKRDAYQRFERNQVVTQHDNDIELLSNVEATQDIQQIIEPFLGPHDILYCEVYDIEATIQTEITEISGFLGFDVAYPGGDYYSAILNGLLVNPAPELKMAFGTHLNPQNLFNDWRIIPKYLAQFRQYVPSERESLFHIYQMAVVTVD